MAVAHSTSDQESVKEIEYSRVRNGSEEQIYVLAIDLYGSGCPVVNNGRGSRICKITK